MEDNVLTKLSAEDHDPVICGDGRQSDIAAALQRGVSRWLRALGYAVVTELVLANGRRADVVGLSPSGEIWIVEIKSCLADYQSDGKWTEYCDYCDRLSFAVDANFPHHVIPLEAGLFVADRFGAELMREPPFERVSPAARKLMTFAFARAAALCLQRTLDPFCGE